MSGHFEMKSLQGDDKAIFRQRGYLLLPGLMESALADFFWSYVRTMIASRMLTFSGDPMVPNTAWAYGNPAFDGLLEYLRPRIEEHSGLHLLPTYSYFRLYKRGDLLKRHRDRPACEVSVSLNIGQIPSNTWPLYVEAKDGPYGALLSPGDALLYRGMELFHWREAFQGKELLQVFLHYVDRYGPYAAQKFDRRATLMRPQEEPPQATSSLRSGSLVVALRRKLKAIVTRRMLSTMGHEP